ncbi:DUF4362 domain-containing protein [Paenibacillus sp. J5C_2022]|uniref:DUF4362 domain-containing protein n=1 Tax=Paenibacillus sp. J5C2022 TaxID=2977129 RepID=UPI0021CF77A7|nr:DUF4362 domain-containing protein [Paenibacillus sp. J5C2022]MCU6709075.1 DUF4362 domain-containing protein [Paenibacillus sp. J5C2022]
MVKRMISAVLLLLILLIAGCDALTGNDAPSGAASAPTDTPRGTAIPDVGLRVKDGVTVSRSLDFGRVNKKTYGTFRDEDEIASFAKAVRTAERMLGKLDIAHPDFDVVVMQDGKQYDIHLWLDTESEQGLFTYVYDTSTGYRLTKKATKELRTLIWGIPYNPDTAAANGDVILTSLGDMRNREAWDSFVESVETGVEGEVQVVFYTKEGDPIFHHLRFDGGTIRHRYDNSHDSFGTPNKRMEYCRELEAEKNERGTAYRLDGCGGSGGGMFYLSIPEPVTP